MFDFVGAYEGSSGVVHMTKLRAEQHRAMARSGEPYMSSDDVDAGFLGAHAEPHVAASHPELVRSARWWRLIQRPCTTPLDSLCARGCGYRGQNALRSAEFHGSASQSKEHQVGGSREREESQMHPRI